MEKDLKRINPKASPKAQFVFDTIAKMSVPVTALCEAAETY